MRVAISSTTGLDRKGLIDCFIVNWPVYEKLEPWKQVIKDNVGTSQLTLNKKMLHEMRDSGRKYGRDDSVIFNRCALDVMAYIMWGYTKDPDLYSEEYVDECIDIFKEALKYIDIIFYMPLSQSSGNLDQPKNVKDIDNCFKFLEREYNKKKSEFFIHDNRPALIELIGGIEQQVHIIKLYLDDDGSCSEDSDQILPPELLKMVGAETLDVKGEINNLLKD